MHKYLKGLLFIFIISLGSQRIALSQAQTGIASWYGPGLHANTTAGGEVFDMNELTAAHPTLPFDTRVKVTNLNNKKSVIVRINDRGPFVKNRIIDVSMEAARQLEIIDSGVAKVSIEVVNDRNSELKLSESSREPTPINKSEIPLAILEQIHREAFPEYELKRVFSLISLNNSANSVHLIYKTD